MHQTELEQLIGSYWRGDTETLLRSRKELVEACDTDGFSGSWALFARSLAAEHCLLMVEKDEAIAALAPWISHSSDGIALNRSVIAELSKEQPFAAGLVCVQLGSLLYRFRQFAEAVALSDTAREYFQRARRELGPANRENKTLEIVLAELHNEIWLARIEMRQPGTRHQVEERLDRAVRRLTLKYENPNPAYRGRLDLLLSIGLSVYSQLDWNSGALASARRRVYRALFLAEGRIHQGRRAIRPHTLCGLTHRSVLQHLRVRLGRASGAPGIPALRRTQPPVSLPSLRPTRQLLGQIERERPIGSP